MPHRPLDHRILVVAIDHVEIGGLRQQCTGKIEREKCAPISITPRPRCCAVVSASAPRKSPARASALRRRTRRSPFRPRRCRWTQKISPYRIALPRHRAPENAARCWWSQCAGALAPNDGPRHRSRDPARTAPIGRRDTSHISPTPNQVRPITWSRESRSHQLIRNFDFIVTSDGGSIGWVTADRCSGDARAVPGRSAGAIHGPGCPSAPISRHLPHSNVTPSFVREDERALARVQ